MKVIHILLLIFSLSSCKNDIKDLNNQIYEAQKKAILRSPYKSAIGATNDIEAQRSFRLNKLPKLLRDKIYSSDSIKDTVFLIEDFDAACLGCPSKSVEVLSKDSVYSLKREISGKSIIGYITKVEVFNMFSEDFNYKLNNSDFIEIVTIIRANQQWMNNSLIYGSDECNDGTYTLITVIYPDRRIEALYVRCWTPYFYRNNK